MVLVAVAVSLSRKDMVRLIQALIQDAVEHFESSPVPENEDVLVLSETQDGADSGSDKRPDLRAKLVRRTAKRSETWREVRWSYFEA